MILFEDLHAEETLQSIMQKMHQKGPIDASDLETLAYIKKFNPEIFSKYEQTLLYLLGLFYKAQQPNNILEYVYSLYAGAIEEQTKHRFTPVQASAYNNIMHNKVFSFSAPTSVGKSHLFRELIKVEEKDIVIIVPSRALIAEYIYSIKQAFHNDNSILILQFIENVNISKTTRRIYIITPERGGELFKLKNQLKIGLFLFDEAQDLEDEIRQIRFDALVRRVHLEFPQAKMVFTQPFTNNPEAQLEKHHLRSEGKAQNYNQLSVGKICLEENKRNFQYFSPYANNKQQNSSVQAPNIPVELLQQGKTILIYISKNKIYKGMHLEDFKDLISLCRPLEQPEALEYIQELQNYIGAEEKSLEKHSMMIQMMKRGIVIHHGSIPLKARLLIERFINHKFARICFATSTLLQGINMPFDVVWIDNFRSLPPLALKNLIGRAGRTTFSHEFNFGYVIIKKPNINTFKKRINDTYVIAETSKLDAPIAQLKEDSKDIVEAIRNNAFNDEFQLTNEQITRLAEPNNELHISNILNILFSNNQLISASEYHELSSSKRDILHESMKQLYTSHLRRKELVRAEQVVLNTAIPILLWRVRGKSFKEVVALRYAYIARKKEQEQIYKQQKNGEITEIEANIRLNNLPPRFSVVAQSLPNQYAKCAPLFPQGSVRQINYDLLVYDTYDYLDKVISLSLANAFVAVFSLYYNHSRDPRAQALANYIKYGTNNSNEIWLLRYGFSFDDIEWINPHIERINENEIIFKSSITTLNATQLEIIGRFL